MRRFLFDKVLKRYDIAEREGQGAIEPEEDSE
jgi:hypothetical protein